MMPTEPSLPIRILKTGLSVFLVYHLLAILILPMGRGLVIRELGRHFITYANLLNLNTTWQFFSPGPSPTFYLEYVFAYPSEASKDDADMPPESEPQYLPEKRKSFSVSDFYQRRLFAMRFLSLNPDRLEKFLVPWLCSQDSKAVSVTIRQLFDEVQNVEKHRGSSGGETFSEMTEANNQPRTTYACPGRET